MESGDAFNTKLKDDYSKYSFQALCFIEKLLQNYQSSSLPVAIMKLGNAL